MTSPPPSNESEEQQPQPDLPAWARRPTGNHDLSDHRLALFIGRKWETTYRRKFEPFLADPSFTPTWNWSAFFATPIWFLYRKLYLPFVLFLFLPSFIVQLFLAPPDVAVQRPGAEMTTAQAVEVFRSMMPYFAFEFSTRLAAAGLANWLLFRRARAATRFVALQPWSEQESQAMLSKLGGVHKGPTILLSVLFGAAFLAQVLGQVPA